MNQIKSYALFLHKIMLKKKSTIILPLFWFVVSIILAIVFASLKLDSYKINFAIYAVAFIELILTIFYASLKALNIYKDLEEEGVELLSYSKPISRKQIFSGKLIIYLTLGCYWALIMLLCNLFIGLGLHTSYLAAFSLLSFVVFILAYIFFGMIASIIGYKLNGKVALAIPLVAVTPLVIGGSVIASQSTATSNNMAYYLNAKRELQPAGNNANIETFYLNNDKDAFYIMPNGFDDLNFSTKQNDYINNSFNYAAAAAKGWQAYAWGVLPYQMIDIFNFENENIFNAFSTNHQNNLEKYLYYNDLDSYMYSYKLNNTNVLPKYRVNIGDSKNPNYQEVYLVPGALKNQTHFNDLINTNIIYARNGADNFKLSFPEDSYTKTNGSSLVGKLQWKYLAELLSSKVFNAYGKEFVNNLISSQEYQNSDHNDLAFNKKLILNAIQNEISNKDSKLNNLDDNITVLNDESIKNKLINSQIEKQIYLTTALIYYIYFAQNNNVLTQALLFNSKDTNDLNDFTPSTFTFIFGGYRYQIGGYESYSTKHSVSDNKVLIRYDLKTSNNYLFQPLEQMYSVSRNKQVINKYGFIGIWIALGFVFILINNVLYIRKDYR
ncbi:ABC transporter permease [Mycoplasma seminis]|uniref:ABC transporter permease n=1 Tax=Mycoplasma seminis TaxID=512749 RepID=A0ABY9HCK2_9MOLU|nr:ABC transporter permease [Mycoplasma seminis]WLP85920.1 ABC transporter permease [Mycoplasma seminis]